MKWFRFPRTADQQAGDAVPYLPPEVKRVNGDRVSGKALYHARRMRDLLDEAHSARLLFGDGVKLRKNELLAAAGRHRKLLLTMGLDVPSDRNTARELVKSLEQERRT